MNCGFGAAQPGITRNSGACRSKPGGQLELHNSKLSRNEDFVFRRIVEEMVLVPIRQNVAELDSIYTLNELGAFIWEQLESPRSHAELEEAILAEYEIDAETVRTDLASFIEALLRIGAVEEV
ncbi:MAG: PqqD family protein [Brevefilum fermentans]